MALSLLVDENEIGGQEGVPQDDADGIFENEVFKNAVSRQKENFVSRRSVDHFLIFSIIKKTLM